MNYEKIKEIFGKELAILALYSKPCFFELNDVTDSLDYPSLQYTPNATRIEIWVSPNQYIYVERKTTDCYWEEPVLGEHPGDGKIMYSLEDIARHGLHEATTLKEIFSPDLRLIWKKQHGRV